MYWTLRYIVLTFLICIQILLRAQTPEYNFRIIGELDEDDLENPIVTGICQDDYGFIWFSTQGGLSRFDGYQFKDFTHDPSDSTSLCHDRIFTLYKSSTGIIWIGTEGGGVDAFDPKTETFTHFSKKKNKANSICSNEIYSICEDQDGFMWFGSRDNGASRLDVANETITNYGHDPESKNSTIGPGEVWNIFVDSKNNVWFSTWGIGLSVLNQTNNSFEHYSSVGHIDSTVSSPITGIAIEDDSNHIWFTNWGAGVDIFYPEINTFKHINTKNSDIAGDEVWPILQTENKDIWFGTYTSGLVKLSSATGNYSNFRQEYRQISYNDIWSLFEDKSSIIWVGTDGGGITQCYPNKKQFEHFYHNEELQKSLAHNSVRCLYQDKRTNIWVGDWKGNLNLLDQKTGDFKIYFENQRHKFSSIIEDNDNNLWVGTYRNGLMLFDRDKEKFVKSYEMDTSNALSISHDYIHDMLIDSDGEFWIATQNGLNVFNSETGEFIKHFNDPKNSSSLCHNTVLCIFEDSKNNLWFGTQNGLCRYNKKSNKFATYKRSSTKISDQSPVHNTIYCINEDKEHHLWIGTKSGLSEYLPNSNKFHHFMPNSGGSNGVMSILIDGQNNVWLSLSKGLSKLIPSTGQFVNYDYRDGIQRKNFAIGACLKDASGKFYFGGNDGFNAFHPEKISDNKYIPPIYITNLEINSSIYESDRPIHLIENLELDYRQKDIYIEFTALNYYLTDKNQYRYMLVGYDADWKGHSGSHSANYTNLSPGEYIFKVVGSNNDRKWNDQGASIKITITPPFWETTAFYAFQSVFFVTLLGFSIYYNRSNKRTATAKVLAFLSLFMVFEYIFVLIEPFIDDLSQGAPFFKVLLNLILALSIIPIEKLIDKKNRRVNNTNS